MVRVQHRQFRYAFNNVQIMESSWKNRLYQGDNLVILRRLLADSSVRGQVRLVYIDPPFGTGQSFTIFEDRRSTIIRSANVHTAYHDSFIGKGHLDFFCPRLALK